MAAEETDEEKDIKWCAILATIAMIEAEGKLPDNDWLITALSDVPGPECEIFKKNYKYEAPPSKTQRDEILLYNDDGLFDDDLPDLNVNQIRKRN